MDSQLVVEQLAGRFRVKNADLQPLHREALAALAGFPESTVAYVPREKNRGADALANRAIDDHEKERKAPSRG
jgi:probable phosphoglycerate mutase